MWGRLRADKKNAVRVCAETAELKEPEHCCGDPLPYGLVQNRVFAKARPSGSQKKSQPGRLAQEMDVDSGLKEFNSWFLGSIANS